MFCYDAGLFISMCLTGAGMRLDRFLQHNSGCSRQEALTLIKSARVLVNNSPAQSVAQLLDMEDQVCIDGDIVVVRGFVYLALNKPAGVVSARLDAHHPTVMDLISRENFCGSSGQYQTINPKELQIVGRLDIDTTGLLLLTSDGEWNYRVTAPEYQCYKTYRVSLNSELRPGVVERFAQGIMLQGESTKTLPATITPIAHKEVLLSISEGRYHQVKRMFAACNNRVVALHREVVAGLSLSADLKPGQFRLLSQAEVDAVDFD